LSKEGTPHRRFLQDSVESGIGHRTPVVPFWLVAPEQAVDLVAAITELMHGQRACAGWHVAFEIIGEFPQVVGIPVHRLYIVHWFAGLSNSSTHACLHQGLVAGSCL